MATTQTHGGNGACASLAAFSPRRSRWAARAACTSRRAMGQFNLWPQPLDAWDPLTDPGVTFQELALSFCWFCGQVFKRSNSSGDAFLVLPRSQEHCVTLELYLGELSNWFATFVRQIQHLLVGDIWPPFSRNGHKGRMSTCVGMRDPPA